METTATAVNWEEVRQNIRGFFSVRSFTFIGTGKEIVYTRGEKTFRFTAPGERLICRQLCDAKTSLSWLNALKEESDCSGLPEQSLREKLLTRLKNMYREF